MSLPTVQTIALRMLRYIGVTQFTPQSPGSELESLGPGDLEDVANAITAALQEIASIGPAEAREAPGFGVLNAPVTVTLTATNGSATISGLTAWLASMQGCTIRIGGDGQDNELLGQTKLARAYLGPSGTATATVYGDTITLDDTIAKVIAPLWLPNSLPVYPATNRHDYMKQGCYPLISLNNGIVGGCPFYLYYKKPSGPPRTWFIDAAYDASLGYTQRRIRFSPMPTQQYSVAYTAGMNPPRVTSADIVSPLTTLVVSGATSNGGAANGTYAYQADFAGFRLFALNTTGPYFIYYNPAINQFVVFATIQPQMFNPVSDEYWTANEATSPLGEFSQQGVATGAITVTTTDAGGGAGDPGTVLPIPNAWMESILLPIALMRFTGAAVFKNAPAIPEITRQYKAAIAALKDSRGQESVTYAHYVGQ